MKHPYFNFLGPEVHKLPDGKLHSAAIPCLFLCKLKNNFTQLKNIVFLLERTYISLNNSSLLIDKLHIVNVCDNSLFC